MRSIPALFETTVSIIQSLTDDKKAPLHVGEVMACWTYLAFVEEITIYEQIGLNTTEDNDLHDMLQESLDVAHSHIDQLSKFMQIEGVPLPDAQPPKPNTNTGAIPAGAKLTDKELANTISINFVMASNMCAASASQSLRTDVGIMFIQFQMDKLTLGLKMKNLMQKRGWLKIPPLYYSPGLPQQ
ncbi:MAG TPA: DUF3231 family protein [Bacillota bacterium]|nr:DUF3231 family protein [Bacillota bacterium]